MAVSAACVTGLAVLDISKDFTFTGQLILVILVQIGGLGIMFLSSLALLFVGQKLSLKQEATLMSVFGARLRGEVKFVLRRILAMAFSIEALGIFILTAHFAKQGSDFGDALWKGTFLAISAFCNAGFFIHTQNLIPFAQDPLVLQVVGWLIVLGGLSPGFIFAFPTLWKKSRNISLQFRFIAVATIFLLTFGTLMLAGLEWNRTLAPFGFWDKLNNAWFHSVTARTAGFNSIDLSQTSPASQVILILLMFIGGAPGSTAGGVKVTTFMVIVFTVWSTTLGHCPSLLASHPFRYGPSLDHDFHHGGWYLFQHLSLPAVDTTKHSAPHGPVRSGIRTGHCGLIGRGDPAARLDR
jgi:trk system potassium uptake protein TrkH